ncbi:hypothetical protein [Nocardia sp. NPDC004860]|uniref:hypothetical protein n=1 Tax=Nocardia sp. NPDC004860 TaxID=3154557 RepID=UPI0033A6430E
MTEVFAPWMELINQTRELAAIAETYAATPESDLKATDLPKGDLRNPCDDVRQRAIEIAELTRACEEDAWRRQHAHGMSIVEIAVRWGAEVAVVEAVVAVEDYLGRRDDD